VKPVGTAGRLVPLAVGDLDDAGRAALRGRLPVADKYLTCAPDAPPLPGILGLFAHLPNLAGDWLAFSGRLLDDPVLDPRDRELLILRVSWRTQCHYEWAQHSRMALVAGLTAEQIAAVAGPLAAGPWSDADLDLLRAVDEVADDHRVADETWTRLAGRYDEKQLLELLFVVGSYLCLAFVLNSAGLEPDAGTDHNGASLPGPEA
jgi:4-carboxymuconolactone decarboxylase